MGEYRRQLCGAQLPADFYDPDNAVGLAARTMACDAALSDLLSYMQQEGVRVAALDALPIQHENGVNIFGEF